MKGTFGAGCFWHVEELFRKLDGVKDVIVGYTGGNLENPTYEDVCTDKTGHAEAVQIEYVPSLISYEELLKVFWENHNPTTPNRQGLDVGVQYRSAVFFHNPEQEKIARDSKDNLQKSGRFQAPIVTEITPASAFYKAEEYHQRYFEKHGGTCGI